MKVIIFSLNQVDGSVRIQLVCVTWNIFIPLEMNVTYSHFSRLICGIEILKYINLFSSRVFL